MSVGIYDLPDELLLEIVNNFRSIRSYEPQSTAFKDQKKERSRQHENRVRQLTLYFLCLTSHRLRSISTPNLYASSLSTSTWHGLTILVMFHRTINGPGNGYGLSIRLADCLQYVETRFSNHLGHSLEIDSEADVATVMVSHYFSLLAAVVTLAKNIEHLSVVDMGSPEASFWRRIMPVDTGTHATKGPTRIAKHGFLKLQTLCVQIHGQGHFGNSYTGDDWFHRVFKALKDLPSLSDFRASDASTKSIFSPSFGEWKTLRRLELTICSLQLNEVTDLLNACHSLRHFVCVWEYCHDDDGGLADLHSGLLRHEECLETLVLDMREIRWFSPSGMLPQSLGSLRSFVALGSLVINEGDLSSDDSNHFAHLEEIHDGRIADMLPASLKDLTLLTKNDGSSSIHSIDESNPLWHVAEARNTLLPSLQTINIESDDTLNLTELQAAFVCVGVELHTLLRA